MAELPSPTDSPAEGGPAPWPSGLRPDLSATHRLLGREGLRVLVRRDWEQALPVEALLSGAPLSAWGRPVPHALRGRAPIHVLATPRGEIVAKRLERGGILRGLLRRRFADPARPLREAATAEAFLARGGRTPPVVAARSRRRRPGGLYALEVATERLPAEGDLDEVLGRPAAGPAFARTLARALGRTLRHAHDAGLRHRDLQVRNLLVPRGFPGAGGSRDPERLVVLDLDRCQVGEPLARAERVVSLARLFRSLVKRGLAPVSASGLRAFVSGYAEPDAGAPVAPPAGERRGEAGGDEREVRAARGLVLEALGRARRAVAWHRWAWDTPAGGAGRPGPAGGAPERIG